jgi:hypothetical protein
VDLAVHLGGDAPRVFPDLYLQQTAAPAIEDPGATSFLENALTRC